MKSSKPFVPQFTANPGLGFLFFDKRITDDVAAWQGHLTTLDGTRVLIQGLAITAPKKAGGKHFELKVLQPEGQSVTIDGQARLVSKQIGSFVMPAFGDVNGQTVVTPIGVLRATRIAANEERGTGNHIRFRIVRSTGGVRQGEAAF